MAAQVFDRLTPSEAEGPDFAPRIPKRAVHRLFRRLEPRAFRTALAAVEKRLPIEGKIRIGGKNLGAPKTFHSVNPCNFKQVIGRFPQGTIADASRAIDAATKAFPTWSRTPAEERSALVLRIAAAIRRRKHEFSALMVLEVGKTWAEADADTAEAIDFCEFYAREMLRYAADSRSRPFPGEQQRARATSRSASAS